MVRETNREARRRARCDQALDVQTRDMFDTVAPVGRPCPSSDPVDSRFRNSHATCEVNKRGQVREKVAKLDAADSLDALRGIGQAAANDVKFTDLGGFL